ncbi:hypothetical protein AB0B15_36880 [Streptomyces sp. NPDC045456]|uniref:hypothetical protein n=1 Tax=Streptomyces sp. NPDC045456 TaxID=3155254 RepID=UPI0033FFED1F
MKDELRTRTPRALAFARALESRGAPVVNSAAAATLCQDRTAMAWRARHANVPFVATRTFSMLAQLADGPGLPGRRWSRAGTAASGTW